MGAGLARERVALATRQDSRDLGFVFPVLRIRDAGQRNRHGSYIPPGPYYEARFVGACLQAKGRLCRPAKVAPQDSRDAVNAAVRKLSGILPGAALPFAGKTRSHKVRRQLWPRHRNLPRSGSVLGPSGTLEDRTSDREPPRDGFTAFPEGPNTDPRPSWRDPTPPQAPLPPSSNSLPAHFMVV